MDKEVAERKWIRLAKPYFPKGTIDRVEEVLKTGWVASGELARDFGAMVAKVEGYKYGLALNSCTSALQVGLEVYPRLDGQVRMPNITFPATANACLAAGYEPVITDHGFDLGVDLYGLKDGDRGWSIGDCACSLGSKGENADPEIACHSFHARKVVSTGEGGALCTDNEVMYRRAKELVDHGRNPDGFAYGYNYRMSDINAAIGIVQLEHLDEILEKRRELAKLYNENLPDGIKVFGQKGRRVNKNYNYQTFVVEPPMDKFDNIDALINYLQGYGIESNFGTYDLTKLRYYREYVDPYAHFTDRNFLALPFYVGMTESDVLYVCDMLSVTRDILT